MADKTMLVEIRADTSKFEQGLKKAEQSVSRLSAPIREIQSQIGNLSTEYGDTLRDFSNMFSKTSSKSIFASSMVDLDKIKTALNKLKLNIEAGTNIDSKQSYNYGGLSALELATLQQSGNVSGQSINNYLQISEALTAEITKSIAAYEDLQEQIKETNAQIEENRIKVEQQENAYKALNDFIDANKERYNIIDQYEIESGKLAEADAIPQLIEQNIANIKAKYRELFNVDDIDTDAFYYKLIDLRGATINNAQSIEELQKNIDDLIVRLRSLENQSDSTKAFIESLVQIQEQLNESLRESAKDTQDAGKKTDEYGKKIDKLNSRVGSFFTRLARMAVMRTLHKMIQSIVAAIKEGFSNLYQFSKAVGTDTAKAVDSLTISFKTFKNSIGSATGEIVTALAPSLIMLLDALTEVGNKLAELFAFLNGNATYAKAIKYQTEWAKSAQSTSKAVRTLIGGFDELNTLNSANSSGNGDTDYTKMFQETEVGIKRLKLDFSNIIDVKEITDKWNEVLNNIKSKWEEKMPQIIDNFSNALGSIDITALINSFADLAGFISNIVLDTLDLTSYLFNCIAASEGFNKAIEIISNTLSTIYNFVSDIYHNVVEWLKDISSTYIPQVMDTLAICADIVDMVVDAVVEIFGDGTDILELINLMLFPTKDILKAINDITAIAVSTLKPLLKWVAETVSSISNVIGGIVGSINAILDGDWSKLGQQLEKVVRGILAVLVSPIDAVIAIFTSLINTTITAINKLLGKKNQINTIEAISIADMIKNASWGWGTPQMANGGIITAPTVATMGEYAGARYNPEIVAPQNLMAETFEASQGPVVNTLVQCCKQIITSIENKDTSVLIGDEQIAQSANRGNIAYQKRTGQALFA